MPSVTMPIHGLEKTVSRQVMTTVLREFLEQTGLGNEAKIKIESSLGKNIMKGYGGDDAVVTDPEFKRLWVTWNEEFEMENISTVATFQKEHRPFASDPEIGFLARPVYIDTTLNLNIELTTASRDEIILWKNTIRRQIAQGMTSTLHDIEYKFIMPAPLYDLIYKIHELEETQGGYGRDFYEYLRYLSDGRLVWGSDLTGTFRDVFIKEQQLRVYGTWDIEVLNNSPKESENGKWSTTFTYKITYQKPTNIYVRYPIMVHNQLLPLKYILDRSLIRDTDIHKAMRDRFMASVETFENQIITRLNTHKYPRIPWFDKVDVRDRIPDYKIIASFLCSIRPDDLRTLMTLDDIDPLTFNDVIKTWLASGEHQYITKHYESVLYVKLLEDDRFIEDSILSIDNTLLIEATKDLNIRKTYRICLCVATDFCVLSLGARDRLSQNDPVMSNFFEERYRDNERYTIGEGWHRRGNNTLTKADVLCARSVMKTVQTLSIFSYKLD